MKKLLSLACIIREKHEAFVKGLRIELYAKPFSLTHLQINELCSFSLKQYHYVMDKNVRVQHSYMVKYLDSSKHLLN